MAKKRDPLPWQKYSQDEQLAYLLKLNRARSLAAFIGAGISVSCGLPDWGALRCSIAESVQKNIKRELSTEEVEEDARSFYGKDFNHMVSTILYRNGVSISNQVNLLIRSGIRKFVSFNFDDVLQEALKFEMIEHRTILNGETFNANYRGLSIFHPHGYLERHCSQKLSNIHPIILSNSDYQQLYREHYCHANIIQISILTNFSVLFVGMSLTDPNTLRLLLMCRELGTRHWHTAIMKLSEEKKVNNDTQKFLRRHGVEPLWVYSFDEIRHILHTIKVERKFNSSKDDISQEEDNRLRDIF